jgi:hypothetical protein
MVCPADDRVTAPIPSPWGAEWVAGLATSPAFSLDVRLKRARLGRHGVYKLARISNEETSDSPRLVDQRINDVIPWGDTAHTARPRHEEVGPHAEQAYKRQAPDSWHRRSPQPHLPFAIGRQVRLPAVL